MLSLALLPLELILVGLVVAESAECPRDGLGDKLNNNLGQTPCTVQTSIQQACQDQSDTVTRNCTCNTIYYNICAACAACKGDKQLDWSQWADKNTCKSHPAIFPAQVKLDSNTIPGWAYQSLTSNNDFNLTAAVVQSSPQTGLSKTAQVAVPLAVGAGVAVLAGLLFWWYRRRRWQRQRIARTKSLSDGWLSYPRLWMDEIWLRAHSTRLKPSRKEPSWEIDDDERWLAGRSTVYHDPYSPPGREQMHELGVRPTHTRDASSSTLLSLSHIEFPTVRRVPTFLERFIKFKDGIRKSATYTAKYVSAISPDPTFRIDGSAADSPVAKKFDDHALDEAASHSKPGSDPQPSFHLHRVSTVREEEEDTPGGAPVMVDRTDFEPPRYPAEFPNEVLVISRNGEDFALDDMSTVAPKSLRTPTIARQPSSVYSSPPLSGGSRTSSSWDQSPRRANTSSTVSGAYPRELRYNPDVTAPAPLRASPTNSWLPAPPESLDLASARTLLPG